jgi:hypothetical protein
MIVILKNGVRLAISNEAATLLRDRINSPEGARNWQSFSSKEGELLCMFNLNEVSAIVPPETIKP